MPRVVTSASRDRLSENLSSLLETLKAHPLYNAATPADRGKIQFACNFVEASKKQLDRLDGQKLDAQDANEAMRYNDVIERCIFAQVLISDMTGSAMDVRGEDPRLTIDFGGDIKAKVDMLVAQTDLTQ